MVSHPVFNQATSCRTSGKETALPPSPPLRTVCANFSAHGSSLSFAPRGTRLHHSPLLAMNLPVAVRMQEHSVVCLITAAFGSPNNVMVVPSSELGDLPVTDGALTVLLFPQAK